ncbi:MAG: hypothetical protein ACK587_08815 [Cyanobacteriota bacterium]
MGQRLIISDNRDDPGNPLVLDSEAIDKAAEDPQKIGQLMVDQVWAEGTDPTGGGLYFERTSQRNRRLQAFETGSEDLMTGGWVRVLVSADQVRREREGMEQAARRGLVRIHGTHRGGAAGGVSRYALGVSRSIPRAAKSADPEPKSIPCRGNGRDHSLG